MADPHFARWQQAQHDAGAARPGARALMAGLLLRFPRAKNWGIYSGRNTALGNLSAHAEGRALDIGCTVAVGEQIVDELLHLPYRDHEGHVRHGPAGLGISVIIHNRRIYSARTPLGRPYGGVPHLDHVHVEMTRKAASHLSLARVRRVIGV